MKLEEILSKILGVEARDIQDETGPDNLEAWNSFNALLLITEVEKRFGVEFDIEEVAGVKNVGDIKKMLEKHGVKYE